ncbi:MAG: hypothetical protein WC645_07580 [Candidatus Margulisiibacteriota bacterium]
MQGKQPRTKYPKLRAWAKPTRKVMTMVIPSKKEKLGTRPARKHQLKKELKNHGI